jgi:pseudoazurin
VRRWAYSLVALGLTALTLPSDAAEHLVRLVTDGAEGRFRFEPPIVFAAPGDAVRLVPDSRLHGAKSIAGMLPAATAPWRGRMGQEVRVELRQPGVYGLKCTAHYTLGMVGLIVVGGDPTNWGAAQAVRHPPAPAAVLEQLFGTAACQLGPAHAAQCARTTASLR